VVIRLVRVWVIHKLGHEDSHFGSRGPVLGLPWTFHTGPVGSPGPATWCFMLFEVRLPTCWWRCCCYVKYYYGVGQVKFQFQTPPPMPCRGRRLSMSLHVVRLASPLASPIRLSAKYKCLPVGTTTNDTVDLLSAQGS
jgi:hypothetical protein